MVNQYNQKHTLPKPHNTEVINPGSGHIVSPDSVLTIFCLRRSASCLVLDCLDQLHECLVRLGAACSAPVETKLYRKADLKQKAFRRTVPVNEISEYDGISSSSSLPFS